MHAALVARGVATGRWPWAMFDAPARVRTTFVLEARTAGGPWEALPLDALFRWRRGFTRLTRLHDAPAMYGDGAVRPRRKFVRWAVGRLAPDAGFVEARLRAEQVEIRGRAESVRELALVPLRAPARSGPP